MSLLKKVETLCESQGISINRLEQVLGFSQGSIRKMDKSSPKADRLYKIAQYFQVPMEYFFNESDPFAEAFMEATFPFRESAKEKPLYRASAGQGCYNDTYADETIKAEDGYEYATVCGDSMLPELRDGDTVKILRQAETTPHDYTLVKVDGEHATIKFVEIVENGVWLRALNKDVFEDKFFTISEVMTLPVTIIGKVVSFERAL